ncbi:type II toxin-antitoxin system RelE/ParE family toxin [Calycomorphotria hydatis]|uniref:Plasmid stabilization system protein n=1 Tax=Calycomorphotria hydatis TaxID=2528027 RepID=A0A517T369_9PLAN|nr:type II toxin-antitoxin system RelE/ParE family toxin [Calycomorphotria hydatis]QDT62827.1 Plasmid stabilization system protein [Calycomorphotria hydatis]
MTYRIQYSPQSRKELIAIANWWSSERDLSQAQRWYLGFSEKIESLASNPFICALADENDNFPYELRQLNYGLASRPTHRALFTIIEPDTVLVLTVRHLAQDQIEPEDISDST